MFKKEWQSIFKNKFMWLVLIGISLIPALYNVIFLSSMWDPYGNVDNLPVAVVNNDQSVDYNGKTLSIGKSLVSNMKKTEALDYHFVSSEKAKKGIDDGDYYLVITIPKDFSKNASTLLTDKPKSMVIDYQTTQGRSFTASKIAQNAVTELKTKVSTQVTSLYSTALLEQFGTVGDGMQSAADGTKELNSGTTQLKDGSQVIATNLDKLSSSSLTFAEGSKTLEVGLEQYTDGVTKVDSGAQKLSSGLDSLSGSVPTLSTGINQLTTGASTLNEGVTSYTDGVSKIANNMPLLSSGSTQLANGLSELSTALAKTNDDSTEIQQLLTGLNDLNVGITNLNNGINNSLVPSDIGESLASITNQATQIKTEVDNAKKQLNSTTTQTTDNSAILTAVTATAGYSSISPEEKQAIADAISNTPGSVTTVSDNSAVIASLDSIKAQADATLNKVKNIQDNFNLLKTSSASIKSGADSALPGAVTAINQLQSGLNSAKTAVDTKLLPGANQLVDGINQVNSGAQTLNSKSSDLISGSTKVSNGLDSVNSKIPALSSGISQLLDGSKTLESGTGQLVSKNQTLLDGTSQLSSGASQIASGASQLSTGENEVVTNLGKVQSGLSVLNTKLTDGADKISEVNTSSDSAKAIATPVKSDHTDNDKLANNGTGMAPYMMSVALFVGMITSCMIFDVYKPKKQPTSGVAWWTSKISVLALVSLVQSILVYGVVVGILGLEPVSHIGVLVLLVLQSLAYMSLIAFFTVALGKVGAFMMLIFMILQLGGSGGTYPTILSNGFFKAIHNFLPMTYGVDGLREVISIGGSIAGPIMVFIFMIIVFNLLLISYYHVKAKNFSFEDQRLEDSIQ